MLWRAPSALVLQHSNSTTEPTPVVPKDNVLGRMLDLDQRRVCQAPSHETERPLPGDRASAGVDHRRTAAVVRVLPIVRGTGGTARPPRVNIFAVFRIDLNLCRSVHKGVRMSALAVGPPHCGKSLQSLITIMTVEPTATTTGQINGNSSSRPTRAARTRIVVFTRAKRPSATSIGHLHLAPRSSGLIFNAQRAPAIANSGVPWIKVKEPLLEHPFVCRSRAARRGARPDENRDLLAMERSDRCEVRSIAQRRRLRLEGRCTGGSA